MGVLEVHAAEHAELIHCQMTSGYLGGSLFAGSSVVYVDVGCPYIGSGTDFIECCSHMIILSSDLLGVGRLCHIHIKMKVLNGIYLRTHACH